MINAFFAISILIWVAILFVVIQSLYQHYTKWRKTRL